MPFTPRTALEIAQSFIAKMLARTGITDILEGSSLYWEAVTLGEELAKSEYRLLQMRNGYYFQNPDITHDMLTERGKELPAGAVPPLGTSAAAGSVMTFYRQSALAVQVLPAGTVVKRNDGSTLTYKTITDHTMGIGVIGLSDVYIICTEQGPKGNAAAGVISSAVNAPDWITGAVNTKPLISGSEAETDPQYQARLVLYVSSLAKSQKAALEFWARSYQTADGARCRFAKCFTEYSNPGYVELVVDDGTGMSGLTQPGPEASGIVPTGGQVLLTHNGPATAEINKVTVVRGAATFVLQPGTDFLSFPEMGVVEVPVTSPHALVAADAWTIKDYNIYTGLLAELQLQVAGDDSNLVQIPGWKAEGIRIRVVPPSVLPVSMDLHVVPVNGVDLAIVQAQVVSATLEFIAALGPGEPLYIAQLVGMLTGNPSVLNIKAFVKGTNIPKDDVYPEPREVLRASLTDIGILPAA